MLSKHRVLVIGVADVGVGVAGEVDALDSWHEGSRQAALGGAARKLACFGQVDKTTKTKTALASAGAIERMKFGVLRLADLILCQLDRRLLGRLFRGRLLL